MGMAPTMAALRAMTDEDLIERHDGIAESTAVGLNFYRDELNRRGYERATAAALEEARQARKLAKANMWLATAAVLVAIVAVVLQLASIA